MSYPAGVRIIGPVSPEFAEILTPEAVSFVAQLVRQFSERRNQLLAQRVERQKRLDQGELPDFLPETKGDS